MAWDNSQNRVSSDIRYTELLYTDLLQIPLKSNEEKIYILTALIFWIILILLYLSIYNRNIDFLTIKKQNASVTLPSTSLATPLLLAGSHVGPRLILIEKVFSTPINFYGKVVDQYGEPVPGADVDFSIVTMNDSFNAHGMGSPQLHSKSDSSGRFSLLNSQGATLGVAVSKKGYYYVDQKSTQYFGYGLAPDSERKVPPTLDNPAILLLWKKGVIEPLVKKDLSIDIDLKKQPITINLLSNNQLAYIKITLATEVIPVNNRIPLRRYDWSSRILIPGGGLQLRQDLYMTTAPKDQYTNNFDITVSKDQSKWNPRWEGNFFVHFPGDYYGRLFIEVAANQGVYPSLRIISYVNPKSGSRDLDSEDNLPYDN